MTRLAWPRFRRNRVAVAGLVLVVVLIGVAILAPLLAPYGEAQRVPRFAEGPSLDHPFGTDRIGRDVFSRVVLGTTVTLRVAVLASVLALGIGTVIGAIAGFVGGILDAVLMRAVDVFLAIPYIVLALALAIVLGRGEATVVLVVGLTGWLVIARITRASCLAVREQDFVVAARALGFSRRRVLFRHVLPNALPTVIAYGTIAVGGAILAAAALSFLGIGMQDPTPAWGLMVEQARGDLRTAPHALLFPAGAIVVTVLAFLAVGDGLRDALDPRSVS